MTNTELKDLHDAIDAYFTGNPIQYRGENSVHWKDLMGGTPHWLAGIRYRPKPQPKTRPWNCGSDVVDGWLRYKNYPNEQSLIVGIDETGVDTLVGTTICHETWDDLKDQEHSTTRKPDSWHPCEVTEEQS